MEVNEFFSLIDALRFDTSVDEQNPELRGLLQKYYPVLRKIYNMLTETGIITESHGNKKHNGPKDYLAANRKGQRDADMDMKGPGFKSGSKIHKSSKMDKKPEKINKDNYEKFISDNKISRIVSESIKRVLKEMYSLDDNPFPENENKNIIYHAAFGEIDYLYNEGVITYNDKNLCAMASGEKPIDYCDLIKCMLYDFKTKLDNEAGQMLRNYYRLSKHHGETIPDVEDAINLAVKNFAEEGNCCDLIGMF